MDDLLGVEVVRSLLEEEVLVEVIPPDECLGAPPVIVTAPRDRS